MSISGQLPGSPPTCEKESLASSQAGNGGTWPDPKRPGSSLAQCGPAQYRLCKLHKVGLHAGAARLPVCAAYPSPGGGGVSRRPTREGLSRTPGRRHLSCRPLAAERLVVLSRRPFLMKLMISSLGSQVYIPRNPRFFAICHLLNAPSAAIFWTQNFLSCSFAMHQTACKKMQYLGRYEEFFRIGGRALSF